jgi:hypothetical protein
MRRILSIIAALILYGCSLNDDMDLDDVIITKSPEYYITAYEEDKILSQTFSYVNERLTEMLIYHQDEVESFMFVYKMNGQLDSLYIRRDWFPQDIVFYYDNHMMDKYAIWNGGKLRRWVYFERNQEGKSSGNLS